MSSSVPALGRVFISYRREDSAYPAGWLFDRLVEHLGERQVFKDIDTIKPGDDFAKVIRSAVAACDVMLVLIGERWLTISGEDGRRRLDHPEDFVRLEIQAALARDIRVIPVLVGQARMPAASQLPDDVADLAGRQALELSHTRFGSDTRRLLRVLDESLSDAAARRAAADVEPAPGSRDRVTPAGLPSLEAKASGLRGWLDSPRGGDVVGGRIGVRGHVADWRHDCKLWIVHHRDPQGIFWPKFPEVTPDDRGNFSVLVFEGGPSGTVIISLLAVPPARAQEFESWLRHGEERGHYPGIYPASVDRELASVTVSYAVDA